MLARQALEAALGDLWRVRAPGMEQCSVRAQLLCLPLYLGDEPLAERVSYAWGALSRGCHQHPYELALTAVELQELIQVVENFVASVAVVAAQKAP